MKNISKVNAAILIFHAGFYFAFLFYIGDWHRLGFLWGLFLVLFMFGYGVAPWIWLYRKGDLNHKFSTFWCLLLVILAWIVFYVEFLSSDKTSEPLLLAAVPIYTFILNVVYHYVFKFINAIRHFKKGE